MWTTIYVTKSQRLVEVIEGKLREQGFMVKVIKKQEKEFEILTPKCEAMEANLVLAEIMSGM